jgi:hypothetical protein
VYQNLTCKKRNLAPGEEAYFADQVLKQEKCIIIWANVLQVKTGWCSFIMCL